MIYAGQKASVPESIKKPTTRDTTGPSKAAKGKSIRYLYFKSKINNEFIVLDYIITLLCSDSI